MKFFIQNKGQLISKANCQAEDSSKKRTNEFVFTNMRRVFVRFLEESLARKKTFRDYLTSSGYGILKYIYTCLGVFLGTVLHDFCCTVLHSLIGTCWGICFSTTLHLGTSISLQRFLETGFVTGEHFCLGTFLQTFLYTGMGTSFSTWVHFWRGTMMHFGTCLQTCLSWQLGGF